MLVNLGAKNSGATPLDTLSIREPTTGAFDENLTFNAFWSNVTFPVGAATGTITYTYITDAGVTAQSQPLELKDGQPFPELPQDFAKLVNFEVTFVGAPGGEPTIMPGAETSIEMAVTVSESVEAPYTFSNVIDVTGTAGSSAADDEATAEIDLQSRNVDVRPVKSMFPGEIWGYKGEQVNVQLLNTVDPVSTIRPTNIVVSEPEVDEHGVPVASEWWDHFSPTAITKTDVPAGGTLSVMYFSKKNQSWESLAFMPGGGSLAHDIDEAIRDDIAGLQFHFYKPGGFGVGESVLPSFSAELKDSLDPKPEGEDITLTNCASASANAGSVESGQRRACAEIEVLAPTPGEYDFLHKEWTKPTDNLMPARSGNASTSRLSWSTSGLSNVKQMVIADTRVGANGNPTDAIVNSVFNEFDLVAISPITADLDPLLRYDKITAVQLWNGAAWVNASAATGLPYAGSTPRIPLTTQERATTTAVRVIVEENQTARVGSSVPANAPAPGSGVARSMGNNRHIDLEWQLRDLTRASATPVLGNVRYNALLLGEVNNIASAEAITDHGSYRDEDADSLLIVDRPLYVNVVKGWSGGPLGVPEPNTPLDQYPSGRVTIKATNDSVAKSTPCRSLMPSPAVPTRSMPSI